MWWIFYDFFLNPRETTNTSSSSRISIQEIACALPMSKTKFACILNLFFSHWCLPYSISFSTFLFSFNGVRLSRKFLAALCTVLGVKHLNTMTYYTNASGQARGYSKTIFTRFLHYDTEVQKYCDSSKNRLSFTYGALVCWKPIKPCTASSTVNFFLDPHSNKPI